MSEYLMIEHVLNIWPDAEYWVTANAATNEYMIRINNELKYREINRYDLDSIKLDTLKQLFE